MSCMEVKQNLENKFGPAGRDIYQRLLDGLRVLHARDVEEATPIPNSKQGQPNAAFEVYKQSGNESDQQRATLEHLNTRWLDACATAQRDQYPLVRMSMEAWRFKGRVALWDGDEWEVGIEEVVMKANIANINAAQDQMRGEMDG